MRNGRIVNFYISDQNWWWLQEKFKNREASKFIDDMITAARSEGDSLDVASLKAEKERLKAEFEQKQKDLSAVSAKLASAEHDVKKKQNDIVKQSHQIVKSLKASGVADQL